MFESHIGWQQIKHMIFAVGQEMDRRCIIASELNAGNRLRQGRASIAASLPFNIAPNYPSENCRCLKQTGFKKKVSDVS